MSGKRITIEHHARGSVHQHKVVTDGEEIATLVEMIPEPRADMSVHVVEREGRRFATAFLFAYNVPEWGPEAREQIAAALEAAARSVREWGGE